jgi:hypothetical protein
VYLLSPVLRRFDALPYIAVIIACRQIAAHPYIAVIIACRQIAAHVAEQAEIQGVVELAHSA